MCKDMAIYIYIVIVFGIIVEGLKNRLKERPRVRKPCTPPPATKNFKSPIQKAFGLPDVPPGEDGRIF